MRQQDPKISLVLGSHAHVPFGSGACEFERVHATLLRPFLTSLFRFPRIQAVFHYSGVLLHWIECAHQELFLLIEDMVSRKQVEMLGGGFYEPVLPIIPQQDRIGQIELLTTYIRRQFGRRPVGCWIPEYAWEQGLVSPLASCGMSFAFLSESQFALAGVPTDAPCLCEDQGKLLTVFPVSQELESALAGKSASAFLEGYGAARSRDGSGAQGESIVSIFPERILQDPGESPERAWSRFFEELSLCEPFIETVSPGKILRRLKGLPKAYIPDSAHAPISRRFVVEHSEAGRLYSKMLYTNMLVGQLRGDKARKACASGELLKAQGGALFCRAGRHGVHSGALRNAAYGAMLGAEGITREAGKFAPSLLSFDFDLDGEAEWLFSDSRLNCYVRSRGGGVFELDYMPKAWNYLDTCRDRVAFADLLLPELAGVEALGSERPEGARLCKNEIYELGDLDKVRRRLVLVLRKSAGPFGSVEIEKHYAINKDVASVNYFLTNSGAQRESFCFATEIDLSMPGETDAFARFYACKGGEADKAFAGIAREAGGIKIHDLKNEVQISLAASKPFDARVLPVRACEDSEPAGLFQAFCVAPMFRVSLEAGETWEVDFALRFSH